MTRDILRALDWLLACVLALMLVGWRPAQAQTGNHGDGHSEQHQWYKGLQQPGTGISCCSDHDCRPTIGELREDGWYASVNGVMTPVPPSKVLHISPPDGRSHVCDAGYGIICFIPAEPRG